MNAKSMTRIVNRKRYSTDSATLIADDVYWDGSNMERQNRNRFLYRTPRGAYFLVTQTQWQGEQDTLEPISQSDAIDLWEGPLSEHATEFEAAFPDVSVEDA